MNVFAKITLASMKKNRARTLATVAGVMLSAAMLTAVITFGVSLLEYMAAGAALKYGDWHVAFYNVNDAFVQKQRETDGVAGVVAYEEIGYAAMEGGENPDKPYWFVAGLDERALQALPLSLLSGRMPQNSAEVVVPLHAETNGGVAVSLGDMLSLALFERTDGGETLSQHDPFRAGQETLRPAGERSYTVVGICQRPAFEERTAPGYTLVTLADGEDGKAFTAFVTLKNPFGVRAYVRENGGGHAYALNDGVLRFWGLSSDRVFTTMLWAVGCIVLAIIAAGSVFLIYNAFTISFTERMRMFGLLASVGATPRQLRNAVLLEGLFTGMAGIPCGILLGIACIGVIIRMVAKNFVDLLYQGVPLTMRLSLPAMGAAVIIGFLTILFSAGIPARLAAHLSALECIRQTETQEIRRNAVKTPRWVMRLCGLEGLLALKSFRRDRKRSGSVVLSLVLSIVLFLAANTFVVYLRQTAQQVAEVTTYDIGVTVQNMGESEMQALYEKLKKVDGVTQSAYQTMMVAGCTANAADLSEAFWQGSAQPKADGPVALSLQIQFLDDGSFAGILQGLGLSPEAYGGDGAALIALAKMDDERAESLEALPDLFARDRVRLALGTAGVESAVELACMDFAVPDSLPSFSKMESKPYILQAVAPDSYRKLPVFDGLPVLSQGMTFLSDDPAQTAQQMQAVLQQMDLASRCTVLNVKAMLEENRNYVFIANVFAYSFIAMISLIALANVFNTISTNISLRRRELAMLRSIGMGEKGFQKMMRLECALYGLKALAVGLPLALVCSLLIYWGMFSGGAENISFRVPWGGMGVSALSVFAVVFITMRYAVGKAKKENILDALRDETA